ncbi:MAG TPA: DUF2269 domain-containing protein [Steroidobacter sp.]|jgi:uncharacterized membrane protein|nr:DUF2269 domain-containing protein [Steroidobacteraceae bacterium]HLS80834.1 DUF2269 domain-containing protein [Steroidobacter sp.]
MEYLAVKWLHVLSSTFLFGTGVGSAFYMLFTSLTRDVGATAVVTRYVVIADYLFTTPTIILQPLSGFYLVHLAGFPVTSAWILWSVVLYLLAVACWLPVVWMQIRMRDLAGQAAQQAAGRLPARYWLFMRWWAALGGVAFVAFVVIFYLMVTKPV